MSYHVLATDYDGTLATDGRVPASTVAALRRWRSSERRLVMVTGRELEELVDNFPELDLFDRVVAENGALLYRPADKSEKVLTEPPPPAFVEALRARGVSRISTGRVIVATWEPWQTVVLDVIREQGLELHVIFNKGAVMILPSSVNKASGLVVALEELGLSAHNAVGVGDAENDHAFLAMCGCGAAVGNSLPTVLERADVRLRGERGEGVEELIESMLSKHLAVPRRHEVCLGRRPDGSEIRVAPDGKNTLIEGQLIPAALEKIAESKYQYLMVDLDGTHPTREGPIVLGDRSHPPAEAEILEALRRPNQNVVVNLCGVMPSERSSFVERVLASAARMRLKFGRPHWLVVAAAEGVPAIGTPAVAGVISILAGAASIPHTINGARVTPASPDNSSSIKGLRLP